MLPAPDHGSAAPAGDERRPLALLLVYMWDILVAVFAFFGALAAFGGGVVVHGRTVGVPLAAQILEALASASLGTTLILVGTLLTRHAAWIRRAQMIVLALAGGLGLASFIAVEVGNGGGVDVGPLFGTVLYALVDVLAIVAMTGPRIAAWYRDPGPVPAYIGGLVAFWAASSVAFSVLRALS